MSSNKTSDKEKDGAVRPVVIPFASNDKEALVYNNEKEQPLGVVNEENTDGEEVDVDEHINSTMAGAPVIFNGSNNDMDGLMALPVGLPTLRRGGRVPQQREPGAYDASAGGTNERRETTRFNDLVGLENGHAPPAFVPPSARNGTSNNDGLVEANAVEDPANDPNIGRADPVDTAQLRRAKQEKSEKECKMYGIGAFLLSVAILAILLRVGFGGGGEDNASVEAPAVGQAPAVDQPPKNVTAAPSTAPTGSLDILLDSLPNYTIASIKKGSDTPQWKAWNWLSNHQNISFLPEWRKEQLFAMACFFYAFEGENWPGYVHERWMDDEKDECLWFSTGYGWFDKFTGDYTENSELGYPVVDPCNEQGVFTGLMLDGISSGLKPTIPPELALLRSLRNVELGLNELTGPFSSLLPREFYQLSNLKVVRFFRNQFTGTLPTELGLLTSMTELNYYFNHLTGHVPTEIGLITNLEWLGLGANDFTGFIPSELGQLTALTYLDFYKDALSGPIPTELGLLGRLQRLFLSQNSLYGALPNELALLANVTRLWVDGCYFSGTIPSEIGLLSSVDDLRAGNNLLSGRIPSEVGLMASLAAFRLENNNLTGTIPHELNETIDVRLYGNNFSGTVPEHLCERLWCDCTTNAALASTCDQLKFAPPEWPGRFPEDSDDGNAATIVVNIETDDFPEQMQWIWQRQRTSNGETDVWETLRSSEGPLAKKRFLYSYTLPIESNTTFQFVLSDSRGNGFFFRGYMTMTTGNETVLFDFEDRRQEILNSENGTLSGSEWAEGAFKEINVWLDVGFDGSVAIDSHVQT